MASRRRNEACGSCGRQGVTGIDLDETGRCGPCSRAARLQDGPPVRSSGRSLEDSRMRGIVARLRERYTEATDVVSSERQEPPPHAHLDWILGRHRNPNQDDATLDNGVSELVVLWLEDLIQELEVEPGAPPSIGGPKAAGDSRQAIVRGLRTAARDFADAFLARPLPSGGRP